MAIRKGTGFTNLSRIMQASQGNKLGQAVSGGIQGQTQGVQSQVKSAQQQFEEEAQKNRLDTGEAAAKRSEILGRFTPSTGASAVSQPQQAQQPQQATAQQQQTQSPVSEQEIKDFTKFRTGTYTGPKELKDVQSLYGKAQQAEQMGELARSEGGRQELLRRFVGGRDYTQGQRQLDTSILGQQPGQLSQAAKQARGASGLVEQANVQAGGLAQEYANRAKAFGQETMQKIGETKTPLSSELDRRVKEAQQAEEARVGNVKSIQDLLAGTDPNFKNLDQITRTGLALQQAQDLGYIKPEEAQYLLGGGDKIGLLQRGLGLGLDMNKLLSERIRSSAAQNIARTGLAGEADIARLNALDRLAGKQGTDLEFLQGQGKFKAGEVGFNLDSLRDYISKTEGERAAADKAYADRLAAEQARYLNQSIAAAQMGVGGAMDVAGAGLNQAFNPESYYNPGVAGQNANQAIVGAGTAAGGSALAQSQAQNAFLEGLTKLNVGGKSLAQTEGGRQLLKAIELKSQLENKAAGLGGQALSEVGGSAQDLLSGRVASGLSKGLGIELAKKVAADTAAKKASDAAKAAASAVKKVTGGGIKISDEDLKTDIDYNPKDLQKFMDRLKPAAYDYKDEVKDSPLASKDRELGVMAQDLEKSELGKEAVHDTEQGKVVDYKNLEPKMLASIAALNKRLNELEKKK